MARQKEHYCASCVLGFSVTQIMFGVISISLHVVLLVGHTVLSPVGHGIWAGIFVSNSNNTDGQTLSV